MATVSVLIEFEDEATDPAGDPPRFTVRGRSARVEALAGDAGALGDSASYETEVTITGESSFSETGTISFGDGEARVQLATEQDGTIGPSNEEGVLHGSVIWRARGLGLLDGATGLCVANFRHDTRSGTAREFQVLTLDLA